jgi:uncharacterized protein YuzE
MRRPQLPRLAPQIAAALILSGLGTLGGCAGSGHDHGEKSIAMDRVPAPARASIEREAAGATIEKVKEIEEDGKTLYVGEFERAGREVEIEVYPDGKVCCVETEVSLADVPAPARAAIERETAGGTIDEIEEVRSVTKGVTYYAVEAKVGGKEWELEIGSDGTVIKKEEVKD